jgi:hypothetical protein
MKFRCPATENGKQCILSVAHVGKVPCKFESSSQRKEPPKDVPKRKPMNAGETRYAQYLHLKIRTGEVKQYWFEGMTLRLADSTRFTVDFLIEFADGHLECHDVKGAKKLRGKKSFWCEEDAKIKIKVAAEMFRGVFVFKIVYPVGRGEWEEKVF